MADADTTVGAGGNEGDTLSADEQAILSEAKEMGWKEDFTGDNFIPAKEFVEKGRQLTPLIRQHNKKLQAEVGGLREALARGEAERQADRAALATLEAAHEDDLTEARKDAIRQAKADLAAAHASDDSAGVADATADLTRLSTEEIEADRVKKEKAKARSNGADQRSVGPSAEEIKVFKAWASEESEFMQSPRNVAMAHAVAAEFRQLGDKRVGKEFLDDVKKEVDKALKGESGGAAAGGRDGKVAAGGANGNGTGGGGKSYNDLPAEAKAACDRMGTRLVGPSRAHKDIGSWRKSYAAQFFKE